MKNAPAVRVIGIALALASPGTLAQSIALEGPLGSSAFGTSVVTLPNGNFVVGDPDFTPPGTPYRIGAVHLYDGSGARIGTLTGSQSAGLGSTSIHVLESGDFVVCSPDWGGGNGTGAATWIDADAGIDGEVSAANSLVGSATGDRVCSGGIIALADGDYIVASPNWHGGEHLGAVTFCGRDSVCSGAVDPDNSLVGSGGPGSDVIALSTGNYAVLVPMWRNANDDSVGAVVPCRNDGSCVGAIDPDDALTGTTPGDATGSGANAVLMDGRLVVVSPSWRDALGNPVGAATLVGIDGPFGPVSEANSLVGAHVGDFHEATVAALDNGNYVVNTPYWDNGTIANAGASTLCAQPAGCVGLLSGVFSLAGAAADDRVGWAKASVLLDGSYVVASPYWSNAGIPAVGAVTWCDGGTGCAGPVSLANSLIGASPWDIVGSAGVEAVADGNYVVSSPYWDDGATADAGLVTFCEAGTACTGPVDVTRSLRGSATNDSVGWREGSVRLSNGNYVVSSSHWQGGAGAVTWANGRRGATGAVSPANSFVGTSMDDSVPGPQIMAVANGNFIVRTPTRDNGVLPRAGAVTLLRGTGTVTGTIDARNSVIGEVADEGDRLAFAYEASRDELLVGKPAENVVVRLRIDALFVGRFD